MAPGPPAMGMEMTVNAVDRCLAVIERLAGEPAGLELGAIADDLGMPKSATHRLLSTLIERGWVVQDAETQSYRLSLRFALIAFRDLDSRLVTDVVQPILDRLARATREYVRLAVVEGETLTWVGRAQGAVTGLRYDPDMGMEVVLHATATGKAWLSTLPEEEALRIVCAGGLKPGPTTGPNAARTVEEVRRALADTRRDGYGLAFEEAEPGIVSLAVVFRRDASPDAPAAGTLSVAGPVGRMGRERHPAIVAALWEAAREMETVWPARLRHRAHQGRPAEGGRGALSAA